MPTVNQPTKRPATKVIAATVGALVGAGVVQLAAAVGVDVPDEQAIQMATATVGAFVAGWLKREGYVPPEGDGPDAGAE